ncbi:restriction endonuclease subunit S [Oscillospiraceae bacterium PP1C4]
MALNKCKLGEFIEIVDERNSNNLNLPFCGININKEFMPTVANTDNLDRKKYKIVKKNRFVYSGMQTGRDECIRISMHFDENLFLISPAYITFEVINLEKLLPEYLFMIFNSKEKDRLGWFYSDSSIRSNLDWDRFCDIDIVLPDITVQQKYVDIYNAMKANQRAYETGLEDLKLVCDGFIDNLKNIQHLQRTSEYIEMTENKNIELIYGVDDVKGMTITKQIIPTKADVKNTELSKFLVVNPLEFVYNPRTHGKKIGMGFNNSEKPFIISWNNTSFKVKNHDEILPEYLFMLLSREEWDRQACYRSWGSSTEVFTWDELGEIKIPVPDIEVQKSIVGIYKAYTERRNINEKLKAQIKDICPVLIKGSLEEGK